MDTQTIATLMGVLLTVLVTIGLFILAGIKNSQDSTNKEIKEMNADIRNMLVKIGENDEKVKGIEQRIISLERRTDHIDLRINDLEKAS